MIGTFTETKQRLMSAGYVDNEYLDAYVGIIMQNKYTPVIKWKTQKHHILPKHYYKLHNLPIDNSDINLVNLKYKDHCLAHYFLALCAPNKYERYCNFQAVLHVLGNRNYLQNFDYHEDTAQLIELDKWDELYKQAIQTRSELYMGRGKGTTITEKQKQQISKKNSNLIYISKDGMIKKISSNYLQAYLDEGWTIVKRNLSEETKAKIRQAKSQRVRQVQKPSKVVYVNNGKMTLGVTQSEAHAYLSKGWRHGHLSYEQINNSLTGADKKFVEQEIMRFYKCPLEFEDLPQKIVVNNGTLVKKIRKNQLAGYILSGWKIGRLAK